MRPLLFGTAVIAVGVWIGPAPANTAPQSMPGIGNANIEASAIKNVGWRRRYYRRYGYPVPYAYYPPAYGYVPPAAYVYPPAIGYAPPPQGGYGDAPPQEGDYADAPPPQGGYGDAPPQEGDYADAPPPQGY